MARVPGAHGSFVPRRNEPQPRENHSPARGCIGHQPDNPGEGWCRVKLPEETVVPSEGQAVAVVLRQPPMYSRRNDVTLT